MMYNVEYSCNCYGNSVISVQLLPCSFVWLSLKCMLSDEKGSISVVPTMSSLLAMDTSSSQYSSSSGSIIHCR